MCHLRTNACLRDIRRRAGGNQTRAISAPHYLDKLNARIALQASVFCCRRHFARGVLVHRTFETCWRTQTQNRE